MKIKYLLLPLGVTVLLAAGIWFRYRILANRDEADFQEQLRLARTERLPTNAAEFSATIQPAKPEENAAPFYRQLEAMFKPLGDFSPLEIALLRHPSPKTLATAQAFLVKAKAPLDALDQATARPRCWFDRDWSQGEAVLMPELVEMKTAAKLLGLRGSVAAANGDVPGALKNGREILAVSKHASEEGTMISALVGESIYSIGLHALANWAVLHPAVATYREALAEAFKTEPHPDIRRENRERLVGILSMIDLCATQEGRNKLGLREEDLPTGANIFAVFMSQPKAKIAIVKAERDYWAALKLPPEQSKDARSNAEMRQNMALLAFPLAARIYEDLDGEADVATRYNEWRRHRLGYAAVLRALPNGGIARSIRTDDLKSPYDGKPLTYSFDGKQMTIAISRPGDKPYRLLFPPVEPHR